MRGSYIIAAAAIVVVIVVVAIILVLDQPGNDGQNDGNGAIRTNSVDIRDLEFDPAAITIVVGTTVTWTNNDSVTHTVTSTSGPASFDSGVMDQGDTFGFTFSEVGTYEYFCTLHPFMRAQVIVTA